MTSPRTPRQLLGWTVPEHIEIGAFGEDQVQLRCKLGDHEVDERAVLKTFETDNRIGAFLKTHAHGETVEYRSLSEVLPETPEPPREERPIVTPRVLLGWTVPSHIEAEVYQGRFWGLCLRCDGERKVTLDYEAEAVAFLKDHGHSQPVDYRPMPGCCGGCGGDGAVSDPDTNGRCPDCYGTGHMHTGSCDPVPASQSFPAVPVSSTGGKETGEGGEGVQATSEAWTLHTAIAAGIKRGLADFGAELTGCTASALTGHVISQLREAGLHPSPLPDSETEWGYRLPWGGYVTERTELAARTLVEGSLPGARVLARREVGPWIEVTS